MSEEYDLRMKMVFVGDSGSGKTNLLTRAVDDRFHQIHLATIGVEFKHKLYHIDGLRVKAQMWDTAGQERFRSLSAPYYRGASVVVLCYSLNSLDTVQKLQKWLVQVKQYTDQDVLTVLVGCKSDLQHLVPLDVIDQIVQERGFKHFVTSSKTGEGVHEAMLDTMTRWTRQTVKKILVSGENKEVRHQQERQKKGANRIKKSCC